MSTFISDKYNKHNFYLFLIIILAIVLRYFAIVTDPFLHPWDERFHALVARNMVDFPLKPMLRLNPATDNYDPFLWCCNHIWVHKQPLFMWQMALSIQVFGINEIAIRVPSMLMGVILVLIIYRITILLTNNKKSALICALLMACSNFHLQLIAGRHGMDHNDIAHGFYIMASIWTYLEYNKSRKWYWAVLIGVFAGCAILNKWLTGLFVYLIWGLHTLYNYKEKSFWINVRYMLFSLMVCALVFVPWQLYILHHFPEEAKYVYEYNRRHITEALDNHDGSILYYFIRFPFLFGELLYLFIPLGFIILFKKSNLDKKLLSAIVISIVFVFTFFALIVKTKMDTYIFFIVPLCLVSIAAFLNYLIDNIKLKYIASFIIAFSAFLILNPIQIGKYLSSSNAERNNKIHNTAIYKQLVNYLPENVSLVMNAKEFEEIEIMFYNNNINAYHYYLSAEDMRLLEANKTPVAILQYPTGSSMPDYINQYPYKYIIEVDLK